MRWHLSLVAAVLLSPAIAAAQPAAAAPGAEVGATEIYERQRTRRAMDALGLRAEASPEGKRISFIRVYREDVLVEDELWPTFPNGLHWLTRESVIRRELLFEEGEAYNGEAVAETERNLRSVSTYSFSLVNIVAVEAGHEGDVGILVYTRDLWSLRFESDFQVTGSQLDHLLLQPVERNLFGHHKVAAVRFVLVPDTYRFGQSFTDQRFAGESLRLSEAADLIINRDTGEFEGFDAAISFGRPFYNLSDDFAWSLSPSYSTSVRRVLQGGVPVTYDIPETDEEEAIPRIFRDRSASVSLSGFYRRGHAYRQTFGAGFALSDRRVGENDETGLTPDQVAPFRRDVLPRQRTEVGPVFRYGLFTPTYETFEHLTTLGQSEDVRSGPAMDAVLSVPLSALGSTADGFAVEGSAGYVLAGGDALLDVSAGASARLEDGRVINQRLSGQVRGATPRVSFARLVAKLTWTGRRNDTSRAFVSLGGNNGLRGFLSQAFSQIGGNALLGNVEIRTEPLVIASFIHLGAVAFYDVGTVYSRAADLTLHHSTGLGLRLLFPQFNRYPFRADVGIPVGEGGGFVPTFGGGQAVPLTATEDAN